LLKFFRILCQNNRFNPVCLTKEAMRLVGYDPGYPRLPLTPGSPEEIAKVKEVMKELKILS
jgi:4-hydroxy-tetrahydrodipicolinate synthase